MTGTKTKAFNEFNQFPQRVATHRELAYESNVILKMLSQPNQLNDEQLLGLFPCHKFMRSFYAKRALAHLPDDPQYAVLKQKIIKAALSDEGDYFGPLSEDSIAIARQSEDPQDLVKVQAIVGDY